MNSYFKMMIQALTLFFIFSIGYQVFASSQDDCFQGMKRRSSQLESTGTDEEHTLKKGNPLDQQQGFSQGKKRNLSKIDSTALIEKHSLKQPNTSLEKSILTEKKLTLEECTSHLVDAWKTAISLERENPTKASDLYAEASHHFATRIRLLTNDVPKEDYLLAAGINWITALSIQNETPEKASEYYEQAGNLLTFYSKQTQEKEVKVYISFLAARLYLMASDLRKIKSEQQAQILYYKATCLQATPPTPIEKKFKLLISGKVLAHTVLPHNSQLMETQPNPTLDKLPHLVQKAEACSTMALLFESINLSRAIQLYQISSQFASCGMDSLVKTEEKILEKYFKITADACWNAAILQICLPAFDDNLFKKSLDLYTLWLTKKDEPTVTDYTIVAQAYSMAVQLFTYKFSPKKALVKYFKETAKAYSEKAART
jgi:hypothetical protein